MNDNTLNFTKSSITALPFPSSGRETYKDAKTPGLQLRVTAAGIKSFSLFKRVNGKPERFTLGKFPDLTVEQARRRVAELSGQIAVGVNPSEERRKKQAKAKTLGEFLDEYVQTRKQLKASTIADMRRAFKECTPDWLSLPLSKITPAMVQARHSKFGKERSEARANVTMRYLRAIFTFASHQDPSLEGLKNPVAIITKTRGWFRIQRKQTMIKPHELGAWLKAIEEIDSDWGDYFLLLLLTGLRKEEALGLRWTDVDFVGKTFIVRDTKNHSDHELPISSGVMTILARRRLYVGPGSTGEFVFLNSRGQPMSNYRKAQALIAKVSGVHVSPHDLRRTFASIAESLDISGYSLKRLLNHTTGDVTQGYVILNMERLRVLMERISGFVLQCSNPCFLSS